MNKYSNFGYKNRYGNSNLNSNSYKKTISRKSNGSGNSVSSKGKYNNNRKNYVSPYRYNKGASP